MLERLGEHRDGSRVLRGRQTRGELQRSWDLENNPSNPRGQLLPRETKRATKICSYKGQRGHLQLGHKPHSQVPRPNSITTRCRAPRPPCYKAQGQDKAGPGSRGLLTAVPAVVHGINGLSWVSAGSGAQPSTRRSPRPCLPVSCHLWEVQLPPLKLKASQKSRFLISWETLPGLHSSIPLLHPPASAAAAVQALRSLRVSNTPPTPARCRAWTPAVPRTSTNTPATGRCPAGRKLPGKARGRHPPIFRSGQLQGRFSRITISDLPRLSPILGTRIHHLAERSHQRKAEGWCQQH